MHIITFLLYILSFQILRNDIEDPGLVLPIWSNPVNKNGNTYFTKEIFKAAISFTEDEMIAEYVLDLIKYF
jgi:hypothetical protein